MARRLGLLNGPAPTARDRSTGPVVRFVDWDTVQLAGVGKPGAAGRYRLSQREPAPAVDADVLRIEVPEPAALERLAASEVLHGRVRELRIEVRTMPPFLRGGLRAPGTGRDSTLVSWSASGPSASGRLGWRRPKELSRALDAALRLVSRRGDGRLEQSGGPDVTSVRAQPRVRTVAEPFGGPLGTAAAFPVGRTMVGEATRYRLVTSTGENGRLRLIGDDAPGLVFDPAKTVEQPLLSQDWKKYATVEVGDDHPDTPFGNRVLLGLAACGGVLWARSDAMSARLDRLGLVTVDDPAKVGGVDGYRISATASRRAALIGDPLLARSRLAAGPVGQAGPVGPIDPVDPGGPDDLASDDAEVRLPSISVLIASKREEDVLACLAAMATQDYPRFEVVLGTHGYELGDDVRREFEQKLTLRTIPIDPSATLGQMLGTLSRAADGELLAKVDDDDHYGADHLTDLLLALRCSGADLAAKSARFVQLADADVTIDRTWSAPEAFEVVPAGGTILVSRAALISCGGWSESPKHVDAELIQRIRSAGGATFRTHGLGYVYVRRNSGHTWQADPDSLHTENEVRYPGLPAGILAGGSL